MVDRRASRYTSLHYMTFVLCTHLVVGCIRSTGHCESNSECAMGEVCNEKTAFCERRQSRQPHACNAEGWCWENQFPQGNDLTGAWVSPDSGELWAVGFRGTIIHGKGENWKFEQSGTTELLYNIWGSNSSDIWVTGNNTLLHWDGKTWSDMGGADKYLHGIWGTSSSDVWIVGTAGIVLRWNGSVLAQIPSDTTDSLVAVWGKKDFIWVVGQSGNNGVAIYWNGDSFQKTDLPMGTNALNGVWGQWEENAPKYIWAVGEHGTIVRWNGGSWTKEESGTDDQLIDIWGTKNDIFVVGRNEYDSPKRTSGTILRRRNDRWTSVLSGMKNYRSLYGVHGSGPNDIWATGIGGAMLHWDGSDWSDVTHGRWNGDFINIWGSGPDDIWAIGWYGTIWHWNGSVWSVSESGTKEHLAGIWGTGKDDVWVSGDRGTILHWDGVAWIPDHSGTEANLRDIWGSGPDDIWLVGFGTILHRGPEARWIAYPAPVTSADNLGGVWGTDRDNVFAVGYSNYLRFDGNAWQRVSAMPVDAHCFKIWGTGPDAIFASGRTPSGAILLRWDGSSWKEAFQHSSGNYYGIWGSGSGGVWLAGNETDTSQCPNCYAGILMSSNGSSFSPSKLPVQPSLNALWGSGPADVWAVGERGTILHFQGSQ